MRSTSANFYQAIPRAPSNRPIVYTGYMVRDTPVAAALVVDFVNTRDIEDGTDELDSPVALRRWIETRLGLRARNLDEAGWRSAVRAREALRDVLASHNGEALPRRAVQQLNKAGATARLGVVWTDDGGARFEPGGSGAGGAVARIFAAVVTLQADGTWERLKVCPAGDCRYAFYDHSKNRSGRWCSMRVCGNRSKTRSFRRRQVSEG